MWGTTSHLESVPTHCSKERQVSRGVEFQFFSKLLRLLGCDVGCSPTNQLEELEPAEGDRSEEDRAVSAGAAAEEWGSVLSQLCSQRSDRHQGPSDDQEGGAEMRGHGGGATRRHEEVADATGLSPEVLATLSECLGLLLEYGVYQVCSETTTSVLKCSGTPPKGHLCICYALNMLEIYP